ncbi:MAG: alpha/beta hydrolase [Ilumatobacteraceae bacterium]
MTAPDRTVDTGSVRLAVDDRGDDALGVPLVLIHGFTGGRIDFEDVIDPLAADRRVVAWDHRGHNDSTNTGHGDSYTFDQLVVDALTTLDHLGLERFHLLGHSMGGVVAQRLVLDHPARVASLILMDTMAAPSLSIPEELIDTAVALGRSDGMGAVADAMDALTGAQDPPDSSRARIAARNRSKLLKMDVEAFGALAGELRGFASLLPRLGEIACPTTVLVGELDLPFREPSVAMASAIAGAELVVIEGAAHCPQEDCPDAWLAAMRHHLATAD